MPSLINASATSGSHSSGGGNGDDSGGSGGHSSCKSGDDSGDDDSGDEKSGDDKSGDDSGSDNSGSDNSGSDTSKTSSDNASVSADGQGNVSTDQSGTSGDNSGGTSGDDNGGGKSGGDNGGGNSGGDNSGGDDSSGGNGNHHGSDDGKDDGDDDGGGHGGSNCLATLTLNKVVVNDNGGTASIADFTLTATSSTGGVTVISGVDPDESTHVGLTAKVPVTDTYVLSETNMDGYDASAWHCSAGTLAGSTLTLAAGDVANCTITNNDTPPPPPTTTIKVDKLLPANQFGGTFAAADFQMMIDAGNVAQGVATPVQPGTHIVSELQRPGYEQVGIECVDLANNTSQHLSGGSLTVAAGQNFHCIVGNQEIPPMLTVTKTVINDNGGNVAASAFQLQIDGVDAAQGPLNAQAVVAGTPHTVGEVATAGYRLVGIACTDDDTHASVPYNGGVTLALGQHVTCNLTNDDDPIDLAIVKTSDGLTKVAGGASFDYTITVRNLGPRDANTAEAATVVDQLPAGLTFVSFPANCTATGQTLTCNVAPADLQVLDPPVVITVTVMANADAPSATYTNLAYVTTADDPACVGDGCVPVCASTSNNVSCATTQVVRQAGIAIDKHDNVNAPIPPGTTFNYLITVTNPGPSTYPSGNMSMTDNLPAGLSFVAIDAPLPWTCNSGLAIACTYNAVLWPNTSAAVITITVTIDANYSGPPIHNTASASAVVSAPAALGQALSDAVPVDPGSTVTVTATDDETTPIVLNADLAIDKSVSQATAAPGGLFDWNLAITNKGPDAANNVVVSDSIPAAFEVVSTSASGGLSCTNTGNSVQCTAASLANGATANAVVHVRVAAAAASGVVTNTATVVTDSTDPNTADNTDSASITVTGVASLAPVPPAAPSTGSTGVSLPRTGNAKLGAPLTLASIMLLGGIFSLVIARRRRTTTA